MGFYQEYQQFSEEKFRTMAVSKEQSAKILALFLALFQDILIKTGRRNTKRFQRRQTAQRIWDFGKFLWQNF